MFWFPSTILHCYPYILGWTGADCSQDVDECHRPVNPCGRCAICLNTPGSYACQCPPGFTGSDCCTPLDPCSNGSSPLCQNGGTCVNDNNGHYQYVAYISNDLSLFLHNFFNEGIFYRNNAVHLQLSMHSVHLWSALFTRHSLPAQLLCSQCPMFCRQPSHSVRMSTRLSGIRNRNGIFLLPNVS